MDDCFPFTSSSDDLDSTSTALTAPITYISAPICYQNERELQTFSTPVAKTGIFVKIPHQINQQYQQQNKSHQIKDEPIKFETTDITTASASQKLPAPGAPPQIISIIPNNGTASNQLPSTLITAKKKETPKCLKCMHCQFLTTSEPGLERHTAITHASGTSATINQTLQCPGCPNKFTKENVLRLHLLEDHNVVANEVDQLLSISRDVSRRTNDSSKSRIYLKNVQSLQNPDLNPANGQPKSGKIFIKNVQLLRKPNLDATNSIASNGFVDQTDFGGSAGSMSEPQFNFEEPFVSAVDQMSNQLFNDGNNVLCQPNFVENSGYSLGNFTTDAQAPIFSNSLTMTQTVDAYGPDYSIPSTVCDQFPTKRSSKIFIKDIKVLKNPHLMTPPLPSFQLQPAIHLKSVRELNLMTLDQVQVQNLLPMHHHHTPEDNQDEPGSYEAISGFENGTNLEPEDMDLEDNIVVDDELGHGQAVESLAEDDGADDPGYFEDNNTSIMYGQDPDVEESDLGTATTIGQNLLADDFEDVPSQFSNILPVSGQGAAAQHTDEDTTNYFELSTIQLDDDDSKKSTGGGESVINNNNSNNNMNYFNLDDCLFVCAEDLINSTLQQEVENKSEPAAIPVDECGDSEDVGQQKRGRIYVATNLMEATSSAAIGVKDISSLMPPTTVEEASIGVKNISSMMEQPPSDRTVSPPPIGVKNIANLMGVDKEERPCVPIGVKNISMNDRKRKGGGTKFKKLSISNKPTDIGQKCARLGCGLRFKTSDLIGYHERCHDDEGEGTRCPECGTREFKNWNTLHTHLWRAHKIDMELYSCHMCDFKTPIFTRLTNIHMKIHAASRDFVCLQCSKAFKNSKQLKNHRRNHRLAEQKSLSCPTCGLKFVSPVAMDAHIEKVHLTTSTMLKWTCQVCDVKFAKHTELRVHARDHAEPKRYACPDCEYVTNDHNAFRRHKMTHSHQPKYKCPMCDYTCIQSTTYRIHLQKRHTNEANDLIHKCGECAFITISKSKYELHVAKHRRRGEATPTRKDTRKTCRLLETNHQVVASTIDEEALVELRQTLDVVVLE